MAVAEGTRVTVCAMVSLRPFGPPRSRSRVAGTAWSGDEILYSDHLHYSVGRQAERVAMGLLPFFGDGEITFRSTLNESESDIRARKPPASRL